MGLHRKRRRMRAGVRALLYIVVSACVVGIGYSGYKIYSIQSEYSKASNLYANIRKEISAPKDPTPAPGQWPEGVSADAQDVLAADGQPSVADEGPGTSPASAINFELLLEKNAETVAWITQPNSIIDYPVVQGSDNGFYLNHLFTGKPGAAGTVFMEMLNAPDFSDKHTILFGHHMNDGSMFASIDKYRNQRYYDEHPTGTLYTPQGDYTVEWFAGYVITPAPLPIHFESDEAFLEYVEGAKRKSNFKSEVEVLPTDRILTLCTCSYVSDDARYILIGVIR